MAEVDWSRLKAHELRKLANENAVVILPIASIEQHGSHLPVMTDTRLGQEIAFRAARKVYEKRPVVVTPVVWSGLSEHHMPFGGTLTLSHDTFRRVVRDIVESITRHGFRDILISNSHGGNIIAMQQILDELAPNSQATLVATTYVTEAGEDLSKHLQDQPGDMHAGEAETSMMLVCEPELVDLSDIAKIASPKLDSKFLSAGQGSYRYVTDVPELDYNPHLASKGKSKTDRRWRVGGRGNQEEWVKITHIDDIKSDNDVDDDALSYFQDLAA